MEIHGDRVRVASPVLLGLFLKDAPLAFAHPSAICKAAAKLSSRSDGMPSLPLDQDDLVRPVQQVHQFQVAVVGLESGFSQLP